MKRADTALVFVILLPSLKSSKLHHHPHHHNQHSHLPHVTIGPYQPWKLDKEMLTKLEEHPRVIGSSPSHNGYQTNIIIDPFSQRYKPTVEIITSDLSTGLELGRTAWSGPGTLTLSTIRGAAANNIHKRASTSYPSPLTSHYQSPLRISQGVPDEDVELITVPVQHRPESQQYGPPAEVMGRLCRSQADCSAAYRAVCAVSQHCQEPAGCSVSLTCQCPAHHYKHLNHYRPSRPLVRRKKRSYRYYEECRPDL